MSSGFININHSKSTSMDYYLRDNECVMYYHSKGENLNKSEIKEDWKNIYNNEKYGNKELGIRGRHDARISTNYVISLPNELSPNENMNRIKELIKDSPIEKCTYTISIHRGEEGRHKNSHAHIIVNERILETQKKDREMQKKSWLQEEFRPKYEKIFEKEFSKGKDYEKRERIETYAYKSDEKFSKLAIDTYNLTHKKMSNDKEEKININRPNMMPEKGHLDKENNQLKALAELYSKMKESREAEKEKEIKQVRGISR